MPKGFQKGHKGFKLKGGKARFDKISASYAVNLVDDLIGTFKSGKYYVYQHILEGTVVYIGKGSGGRAWSKERVQQDHYEQLEQDNIEVKIICSDLSEEEALAIERCLIKLRNPIFNTVHATNFNQLPIFNR
jgi:hypothetical protein